MFSRADGKGAAGCAVRRQSRHNAPSPDALVQCGRRRRGACNEGMDRLPTQAKRAGKRARTSAAAVARPRTKARVRDAAGTQENILQAAIRVFADRGFAGGRIDRISREARSNDRMIYYYYRSKENLFVEVLERTYRSMREAEEALQLDLDDPVAALKAIVRFSLDHYLAHPEMVTLLNSENLDKGKHVSKSRRLREISSPAMGLFGQILRRGQARGVFRKGLDARQLYLTSLALNYFYFSNRYTLSAFLGIDLMAPAHLRRWRAWIEDVILRAVLAQPAADEPPNRRRAPVRAA
jgi:AcrR family transcriptional regulator